MNKQYGIAFKKIRNSTNLTLANFSSIGLPASTLSDFERGVSMISLEKIDNALQLMGLSLTDYDNYLNHYVTTDSEYILQKVEECIMNNDFQTLVDLQLICEQTGQLCIKNIISIFLGELNLKKKDESISYLYSTNYFGTKELWLFYVLIGHILPKDILNILKNINEKAIGLSSSEKYARVFMLVLCEISLTLSFFNYKEESRKIIHQIKTTYWNKHMFFLNYITGVEGYWQYKFQNKDTGKAMVNKFLKIHRLYGDIKITQFYEKKFKKLIN